MRSRGNVKIDEQPVQQLEARAACASRLALASTKEDRRQGYGRIIELLIEPNLPHDTRRELEGLLESGAEKRELRGKMWESMRARPRVFAEALKHDPGIF
jgi:hypothetical protein